MITSPYFLIIIANGLDFTKKSGGFISFLGLFFLLFTGQFLSAQDLLVTEEVQLPVISLQNGVEIYSGDDAFNQQIKQGRITVNKGSVSVSYASKKNRLFIAAGKAVENRKNNLSAQVKNRGAEKTENLRKKVQKQIADHIVRTKSFLTDDFKRYPSSNNFSITQGGRKNYISQRTDYQAFSKIYFNENKYSVKRALDDLHAQRFNYDNNKSLDCCFSEVFSVRPPPVFS